MIRLVKKAFQENKISTPDEARERIFPQDLTVHLSEKKGAPKPAPVKESSHTATEAESDLKSDAKEMKEQAQNARLPEKGKNLLS